MSRRAADVRLRMIGAATLAAALALVIALPLHAQRAAPAAPRSIDVYEKSMAELQAEMDDGRATAREIAAAHLARIAAYDLAGPALNAFITLNPRALDDADALDRERRERGPRGPLHGIPIVVKDNYETADLPTTGGTVALAGFRTGRDAFLVKRLREAGAVILGKTNLHELAAGIITISSMGGQTRNPYDPARTPGGSSGGTAAAVAAGFAVGGLASDTCGSIRIPAANNNLVGLRGTLGSSSRTGIIPLSHTQDIGGPLARSVADLALLLDVTTGADPDDPSTRAVGDHPPFRFHASLDRAALKGARLGVLTNYFGTAVEDEEVNLIVRAAIETMKAQGAEVVNITIPGLDDLLAQSSLITLEFKTDLANYLANFPNAPVRTLQEILDRGAYHAALEATFKARNAAVPEAEEIRKVEVRRASATALVRAAMDEHRVEGLIYPTLRRRPVVVEEPQRGTTCQLSATTGFPAMAMPAGFTTDGVPIGLEILGPAWSDARLVSLAYAYEQAVRPRRPAPTTPALVNGAVPPPVTFTVALRPAAADARGAATARFEFDPVSGRLAFELPADAIAASIHRAEPGIDGPVLHRLINPAAPKSAGTITLPPYQRPLLNDGTLYLSVQRPSGRTTAPLRIAATPTQGRR
ncbi:MAG: amidase [Acidobacteria bacterium]|nr:amidase [Acidobacteriota bacterium]